MAATTLATIPPGTYSGTILIPQGNVPDGVSSFRLTLDITQMTDPATSWSAVIELSLDGSSWDPFAGAGGVGGPAPIGKDGVTPLTTAYFENPILDGVGRLYRGTVVIVGSITTSGTATVT